MVALSTFTWYQILGISIQSDRKGEAENQQGLSPPPGLHSRLCTQ